jgi:hypothetical protein
MQNGIGCRGIEYYIASLYGPEQLKFLKGNRQSKVKVSRDGQYSNKRNHLILNLFVLVLLNKLKITIFVN